MATIPGVSASGLLSPAGRMSKATVHPLWVNQSTGKWSAILPTGSAWNLIPDLSVPGTATATNKSSQNLRPTVVTHATGYYVIWSSTSTSKFQAYDWANALVGAEVDLPLNVVNQDQSPLTAVLDSLGQIWIARVQAGVVSLSRSTDNGLTWSGPAQIGTVSASQNGVVGLVESNGAMQALVNGNDGSGRLAMRIALTATNLAQGNWTVETLPALVSGASSDDHLGITAAADGTVYAALKTSNDGANITLIYLLRRTPAGVWTAYDVEVGPDDNTGGAPAYTRPSIALVGDTVHVLYGSIQNPMNLNLRTASVTDLSTWSARTALLTGPDYSDSVVVPAPGDVVPPMTEWPLITQERLDGSLDLLWLPTNFPEGGGSMIGDKTVLATQVGTEESTKAYLGTEQVDGN